MTLVPVCDHLKAGGSEFRSSPKRVSVSAIAAAARDEDC